MANWALLENEKIVKLEEHLPQNWKNITNFNLLENDVEFLKTLGWFPVIKQHQNYDTTLYKIDSYNHDIVEGKIIESLNLIENDLKLNFQILKNEFLEKLRKKRNELLKETDWTQTLDVQEYLLDETKIELKIYRQKLRDLVEEYSNNNIVVLNDVVWPKFPVLYKKNNLIEVTRSLTAPIINIQQ